MALFWHQVMLMMNRVMQVMDVMVMEVLVMGELVMGLFFLMASSYAVCLAIS